MNYRTSIPPRCNAPATHYSETNGYRTCGHHLDSDSGAIMTPHNGGRCDYPLDGMGAARYLAPHKRPQ